MKRPTQHAFALHVACAYKALRRDVKRKRGNGALYGKALRFMVSIAKFVLTRAVFVSFFLLSPNETFVFGKFLRWFDPMSLRPEEIASAEPCKAPFFIKR